MNLVVTVEDRYVRTPDGAVWAKLGKAYSFWARMLQVFGSVKVVARVKDVETVPPDWHRADGDGVAFSPLPYYVGPLQYLLKSGQIRRTLRSVVNGEDAVILCAGTVMSDYLQKMLMRTGQPYGVMVVGDPLDVFAPGAIRHPLRPFFRRRLTGLQKKHCREACAASYVTDETLQKRYPCPGFTAALTNLELPEEALVSIPRGFNEHGQNYTLVSVGTMEQLYKAQDVLIEAVANCVSSGLDLNLKLIGDGKHRQELKELAARLGISERVIFKGHISAGEAVRRELDESDIFVLPSRTEGLPRAMIEAMARGLPCIGSTAGGIPELLPVEDLVPPGDAPALAAKLKEVVSNTTRMSAMSARNLKHAGNYRDSVLRERRNAFYRFVKEKTEEWQALRNAMKLVHVTTVPETLAFLSGQVGFMQSAGFEVHAVASSGERLDSFGEKEGVITHQVEMSRKITPIADLVSLVKLTLKLRRIRPGIIHAHTPKGGLLGMLAGWLTGVPVRVYHVHGLPMMTAVGFKRAVLKWAERVACRLADRVMCVSNSIREVAVNEGLCPEPKIKVLLGGSINGVDANGRFNQTNYGPETRVLTRAKYGIPESTFVIGYIGRIVKDKGIIELAEAWEMIRSKYPEARLLMVGPYEPHDPVPKDVMGKLKADLRVTLTGEEWNTPPLYSAMDIVVLPSYREGFPVVPMEAAAMELAVVATDIPGCRDAVQDGVTGTLVTAKDAAALAEAIQAYIEYPQLRRKHGAAARKRMLSEFSQEAIWKAMLAEYRYLLNAVGIRLTEVTDGRDMEKAA